MKKYQIVWSPYAEESYLRILTYIIDNWTVKEAEDFDNKAESLLERLKTHKHLCPAYKIQEGLIRCEVAAQTSLVYLVRNENIIELVAFFDNRSNHKY
jgi:plasmid stabilization system protein ParE